MGWLSWLRRKGLVPTTETTAEKERNEIQKILQNMIHLSNKIQRDSEKLRKARARGNDPEVIRVGIVQTEQDLLGWTRKLEKFEIALVEEEKRNLGLSIKAKSVA